MRARKVNETLDFERGKGAKRAVNIGSGDIRNVIGSIIPNKAKRFGFQIREYSHSGNYQFGIFREVGEYYEDYKQCFEIAEVMVTQPVDEHHKEPDKIEGFIEDGYVISYTKAYRNTPEKDIHRYIKPSELLNDSWWKDLNDKIKEEGFEL